MSTSEDEWKVVTKDDKKRVMRRTNRGRQVGRRGLPSPGVMNTTGFIEDARILSKLLTRCQEELLRTQFFRGLIDLVKKSILSILPGQDSSLGSSLPPTDSIDGPVPPFSLVCYGIGNFSRTSCEHYSASLWQLACSLALQAHFSGPQKTVAEGTLDNKSSGDLQTVPIFFYDPCSTAFEQEFLQRNLSAVKVGTTNDRGRQVFNFPTLFFMPHCPRKLYDNVLWSNVPWRDCSASKRKERIGVNFFFYGNSLLPDTHVHTMTVASDGVSSSCPCISSLLPFLKQQKMDSFTFKEDVKMSSGNFVGAFNDLYITTLVASSAFEDEGWPARPPDGDGDTDAELV